jgi:hypothetical protein
MSENEPKPVPVAKNPAAVQEAIDTGRVATSSKLGPYRMEPSGDRHLRTVHNIYDAILAVVFTGYLQDRAAFRVEADMGIVRRGNSKYWYVQFQFNGETYIKSSKTTDKKLAEHIEADWRRKLVEQDVFGTRDRIALAEAFRLFCKSKTELADHSNLVRNANVIVDFLSGRRFLDELTTSDIERLRLDMQAKGYQNQTTKHRLATIRGAIKYCRRMGYQVPTVEYPTLRISKGKLRYLSFDEEKRLIEAVDPYRTVKGLALPITHKFFNLYPAA